VLIGVAVIALLLVGVGGYGVLQERSALQDEIRKLQARMATAVSQEEARANRLELQNAVQRARDLEQDLERVQEERARISEQLAELQEQSNEQAARLAAAEAARRTAEQSAASAQAAARSRPSSNPSTSSAPATTAASGEWFVNFGSYAQRAVAERWQSRLQPEAGRLLIQEASSNGRPLYRLRVVGLSNRDSAERVARQLERDYKVERLWVGKDSP
jgi:cell division septation protein DedD